MDPSGKRYRVNDVREDELVLVELATVDPDTGVPTMTEPSSGEAFTPIVVGVEENSTAADLESGYVIEADLSWRDGDPRLRGFDVLRRTRFYYADEVTGLFDVARETWREARAAGDGLNSRVTRGTDGDPNGALYTFAEGPGRDLLSAFRAGRVPLEPLVGRVNAERDDARERAVFVLRPVDDPFVVVYVAFDRDGLLARTVRDTYDVGGPVEGSFDLDGV